MKTIFNSTQDLFASIKKQTPKIVRYLALCIFAAALVSCNDDLLVDIEPVESEFTVNIDVSGIVNDFTDIDGSKLFPNGAINQDRSVEVRYSVYDEDGAAVINETVSLQDFSKKESITKSIKNGIYTIVASAYISDKSGKVEFWKPENINDLYKYRINYSPGDNWWIGSYGVLGVGKRTVAINKSQTVNISMSPVVSMVFFHFTKCDVAGIKKLRFVVESFNDYFDVDEMQGIIKEQGNVISYDFAVTSQAVATAICYLPTSKFTISWQGFDAADKEVNKGVVPSSAVKAGETKVITINTEPPILKVDPDKIIFEGNETGYKTATVTTNAASWDVNTATTASWLKVEKQGNTLRFTPESLNTGTSDRTTTVTVTAVNLVPVTVQVTQKAPTLPPDLPKFEDIVGSTYTATGTPIPGVTYPAPGSWSGLLIPFPEGQYYAITNWANLAGYPLWIDFVGGKLFLDNSSLVKEDDNERYYYAVGYRIGGTTYYASTSYNYEVTYNKTTGTLDFTGTYNGYPAMVFLLGVNKTTGNGIIYTDTALTNAKLVLTPASSSSPSGVGAGMKSNVPMRKSGKVVDYSGGIIPMENVKSLKDLKLQFE